MRIDAHHHFWRYNAGEYGWITDGMELLRRDFLPEDLGREIRSAGIDGVVSVQARQTLGETRWLLSLAEANEFIKGVVGWVPLVEKTVRGHLAAFAENPKLRAVRHVVQCEADGFLLREDFNAGVAALKEFGLAYDVLVTERQLAETIPFVDRHPEQVFVLDHMAKPRIKDGFFEPWIGNIRELAKRENVFCKLTGMVTEADWKDWTEAQLRPYAETVLEAFGPARTMFGSDWPVCLVASGYGRWIEAVWRFAASLSSGEQERVFALSAMEAYHLK